MYGRLLPPFSQLLFASILGIAGGVYIFQPWYFVQFNKNMIQNDSNVSIDQGQLMDEEEVLNYSVDASSDK